jgi:hypothetical protein
MASSKVDVCNMALAELADKPITSLTDATERARLCNQFFDDVMKLVLRDHNWRCAMKRAQLSRLEAAPAFGFLYQYELPSDWVRTVDTDLDPNGYKWTEEDGKLLTDETAVNLRYVYLLDNPAKWEAQLTECIAAMLACKLTFGLTGKATYKKAMGDLYQQRLHKAQGVDSQAQTPEDLTSTVLIECRF